MLLSLRTVARNLPVMLIWGLIIAVLLIAGRCCRSFLGLFVVSCRCSVTRPGHLYRRALYDPERTARRARNGAARTAIRA